ncbi:hypothetical protein I4U23_000223 [Adineta vaga]|nr:hypothetical protein I4U23_000223 [Adineta vaga]
MTSLYWINCLSISQLISLISNGLYRIISTGWSNGYDFSQQSADLCKFRVYSYVFSIALSRHFLCLISLDRWMKTSRSVSLREKSSRKYARWLIPLSFLFWILIEYPQILTSGCLSIAGQRIHPILTSAQQNSSNIPSRQSKTDFQLIRLSIIQIICFIILNIIASIFSLYIYFTSSQIKSTDRRTIETLISYLGQYLLITYTALTFGLYILASSVFRQEFKEYLKITKQRFMRIIHDFLLHL